MIGKDSKTFHIVLQDSWTTAKAIDLVQATGILPLGIVFKKWAIRKIRGHKRAVFIGYEHTVKIVK